MLQVIASICFYSGKAIDLSGEIMERKFSAVITKEGKWFVSHCPELGVASQGKTKKSALKNLKEAVELYLEKDPLGLPEKREVLEFKAKVATHA